jgi:hypothetical protein
MHDENVVYAAFNNHKNGDFKPYLLKSTNKGGSWVSIAGNLPERGSVYALAEDHINPNLLFVGTEFGVFFTLDGGKIWKQLSNGLPTIAVYDLTIQQRENDLVLATFGRGFYILDDYSPLRSLTDETLDKDVAILPIKDGLLFNEAYIGGIDYKGNSYYGAKNPPIGATMTYYIKEAPKSLKAQRKEKEKEQTNITWPTADEMRAEDNEETSYLLFEISDANGTPIRRFTKGFSSGVQRTTWDGRYGSNADLRLNGEPMTNANDAFFAAEGVYSVKIYKSINGKLELLAGPENFNIKHLKNSTLYTADNATLLAFQKEVDAASRELNAVDEYYKETNMLIDHLKAAARNTPGVDVALLNSLRDLEGRLEVINMALNGDQSLAKREYITLPNLQTRLGITAWGSFSATSAPTGTQRQQLKIVQDELPKLSADLQAIMGEAKKIKEQLYKAGSPYLRGDLPEEN